MIVLQTLTLLGAMCLFLYGMTLMSEGLQKAAAKVSRKRRAIRCALSCRR